MTRPTLLLDYPPVGRDELFTPATNDRLDARFHVHERGSMARDVFYERYADQARYIIGSPPLDRGHLLRATSLRAVFSYPALLPADVTPTDCQRLGVQLLCPAPATARHVGEVALGLALSLIRGMGSQAGASPLPDAVSTRPLVDRSLGIVGWGALARGVADTFDGLVQRIRLSDPAVPRHELDRPGRTLCSRDETLESSDIVVLLEPLTPRRFASFGAEQLARLKPGTILIVLSRADVIDRCALHAACSSGRLQVAFEEPFGMELPADDALRSTPNVLVATRSSCMLPSMLRSIGEAIAHDIERLDDGGEATSCEPISSLELLDVMRVDRSRQPRMLHAV